MEKVKNNIKKVRIINNNRENCTKKANDLKRLLLAKGFEVTEEDSDLVIFLGGDGTFLAGCQMIDFSSHPICIGINSGTLGILQNYDGTLEDFVTMLLDNDTINIKEIPFLEVELSMKYDKLVKYKALNEVSIIGDALSLSSYREWINGYTFQVGCSSGIIVSSTIGSTGISKDFGSPIIANEEKLLVRSIVGSNFYKVPPFLTNPIVCNEYRIDMDEVYKNSKLQIDGIILENINVKEIFAMEVKYSNQTMKLLCCENENSRVERIREKIVEN